MRLNEFVLCSLVPLFVCSCETDRFRFVIFNARTGYSWNSRQLSRIETDLSRCLEDFGLSYNRAFDDFSRTSGRDSIAYTGKVSPLLSTETLHLTPKAISSFRLLEKDGGIFVSFNRTTGRICVTQTQAADSYHPYVRRVYEQIEVILMRTVGLNGYKRNFSSEGLVFLLN